MALAGSLRDSRRPSFLVRPRRLGASWPLPAPPRKALFFSLQFLSLVRSFRTFGNQALSPCPSKRNRIQNAQLHSSKQGYACPGLRRWFSRAISWVPQDLFICSPWRSRRSSSHWFCCWAGVWVEPLGVASGGEALMPLAFLLLQGPRRPGSCDHTSREHDHH